MGGAFAAVRAAPTPQTATTPGVIPTRLPPQGVAVVRFRSWATVDICGVVEIDASRTILLVVAACWNAGAPHTFNRNWFWQTSLGWLVRLVRVSAPPTIRRNPA
jgi:hypothetical protein